MAKEMEKVSNEGEYVWVQARKSDLETPRFKELQRRLEFAVKMLLKQGVDIGQLWDEYDQHIKEKRSESV